MEVKFEDFEADAMGMTSRFIVACLFPDLLKHAMI